MRITRAITAARTLFAAVVALTAVTVITYRDDGVAGGRAGVIEQNNQASTAVGSVGPKWAGCAISKAPCEELIATMSAYAVPALVRTVEDKSARCRVLPEWQRRGVIYERMCGDPPRSRDPASFRAWLDERAGRPPI
jgi:hypothetical protein